MGDIYIYKPFALSIQQSRVYFIRFYLCNRKNSIWNWSSSFEHGSCAHRSFVLKCNRFLRIIPTKCTASSKIRKCNCTIVSFVEKNLSENQSQKSNASKSLKEYSEQKIEFYYVEHECFWNCKKKLAMAVLENRFQLMLKQRQTYARIDLHVLFNDSVQLNKNRFIICSCTNAIHQIFTCLFYIIPSVEC